MKTKDFTTTLLLSQTPAEAFDAIKNIGGWWSAGIDGDTENPGDEFIYHYKDIHYAKLKLIERVPEKRLVWLVLDNYFKFTKDKTEWKNTRLVFDISRRDNKTGIKFTHEGLVPQYECYEVCREAWTNYIQESLRALITTGKGQPSSREDDGFDADLVERWSQQQQTA